MTKKLGTSPVAVDLDTATRLLTVEEAARALGVSKMRGYALVRDGILPAGVAVRLGRQVRVDARALREFIARGGSALSAGWRRNGEVN